MPVSLPFNEVSVLLLLPEMTLSMQVDSCRRASATFSENSAACLANFSGNFFELGVGG
jgi:hypothetical protein